MSVYKTKRNRKSKGEEREEENRERRAGEKERRREEKAREMEREGMGTWLNHFAEQTNKSFQHVECSVSIHNLISNCSAI